MNKKTVLKLLGLMLVLQTTTGLAETPVQKGEKLWVQEVVTAQGESRSCTTCHGTDLQQAGQHQKTKKSIEPMARSVNSSRYEDPKKVEKWFKRNCKWVWGRECSDQEKSDILAYLLAQ